MRIAELLLSVSLALAATDHPTGSRTTPPTLNSVSPVGVSRGTTVEMTVEGLNLAHSSGIYFSQPGVTGRILRVKELPDLPDIRLGSNGTPSTVDVGPLPPRNQVTVEIEVDPEANIGPVSFRLLTPLGTSPEGRFLIEPYYGESPDREPNDTPENAFECYLPTILAGTISKPGDVDYFKIQVKDGEELSFLNGAMLIGSQLQPVVTIFDESQNVVREFGLDGGPSAVMFAHRFTRGGTYYIRVSDYLESGRAANFYRIVVGKFPLATSAYPLGMERGKSLEVTLSGWRLSAAKVNVNGTAAAGEEDFVKFRPKGSFTELELAVGGEPEVEASGGPIAAPVTINGRIARPGDENRYRFHSKKGEQLVFEVNARRLGSDLDSFLEITDTNGKPVERAVAHAILETSLTLRDHDSAGRGMRISSWSGLAVGDYILVGTEIVRIEALPRGPDDDMLFEGFAGQRTTFFGTTAEAHAIDTPAYKVQIHPAGTEFARNGLPLMPLYYRNDDGGPGFGKDSYLSFTAPADGDYLVKVRDVRGLGGEQFAYRLTVRPPRPDFRLTVAPRNPNVPVGGCIPVNVTAQRLDGFQGPIEVALTDLPRGLHATRSVIGAGELSTTILLSADADAKLETPAQLQVRGDAKTGPGTLTRWADPADKLRMVALMPRSDVLMTARTKEVTLEAGGTAEVEVEIQRQNGFRGRVPVEVRSLPQRVLVLDVGLNGVLLNEDESKRSFTLEALPTATPGEQWIYVSGQIETRSGQQNSYAAPQPILLRIKPKS